MKSEINGGRAACRRPHGHAQGMPLVFRSIEITESPSRYYCVDYDCDYAHAHENTAPVFPVSESVMSIAIVIESRVYSLKSSSASCR
jgi:hypothetical protein